MKKNCTFILGLASIILACPLLSGCGSETVTQVALDHGQLWNSTNDDVNNPNGHFYFYNKASDNSTSYFIPYLYLGKLIEQKANFVLVVVGSSDGCSCWTGFRNNVLTKYMMLAMRERISSWLSAWPTKVQAVTSFSTVATV